MEIEEFLKLLKCVEVRTSAEEKMEAYSDYFTVDMETDLVFIHPETKEEIHISKAYSDFSFRLPS